jgi:hypothetical protein
LTAIKGYEVAKGEYIELDPEELEAVALESKRTIEIDEFVPKSQIDELYIRDPYYIAPDGEVGQQAFQLWHAEISRCEGCNRTSRHSPIGKPLSHLNLIFFLLPAQQCETTACAARPRRNDTIITARAIVAIARCASPTSICAQTLRGHANVCPATR